ncbi:MAG: tRNA lysidine(34) synthetase TilS [Butyrivibrio sp.]|nr:tRNA lysidine(34) synthetase TilS [Butyrivibrio sp.]
MYDRVKNYIKKNKMLEGCRHIVIGLSGGADSVCLAHILKRLSRETGGFTLSAVHIHHGIRGGEADRDRDFCEKLCERLEIRLKELYFDVPAYARERGITCEEAGRLLRYGAFASEAAKYADAKTAVAHHMNDQAETVIFNMCRGSGIRGMRGMLPEHNGIIRPLLCCTRAEIESFLEREGESFCTDSTNKTDDYARNRIRHGALPFLEENINARALSNIAAMAGRMAEAEAYLEAKTDEGYAGTAKRVNGGILLSALDAEEPYIAKRIIMKALGELSGGMKDVGDVHVEAVAALADAPSGKSADVCHGIRARRAQNGIFLCRGQKSPSFEPIRVEPPCVLRLQDGAGFFEFSLEKRDTEEKISNSICTKFFDYDKIKFGLWLRTREDGDFLTIDSLGHHKKLNQYYIDEKIPEYMRDCTPVLADGSHILWVAGGRISEEYKLTDDTKRVLKVRYGGLTDGKG